MTLKMNLLLALIFQAHAEDVNIIGIDPSVVTPDYSTDPEYQSIRGVCAETWSCPFNMDPKCQNVKGCPNLACDGSAWSSHSRPWCHTAMGSWCWCDPYSGPYPAKYMVPKMDGYGTLIPTEGNGNCGPQEGYQKRKWEQPAGVSCRFDKWWGCDGGWTRAYWDLMEVDPSGTPISSSLNVALLLAPLLLATAVVSGLVVFRRRLKSRRAVVPESKLDTEEDPLIKESQQPALYNKLHTASRV